MLASLAAWIRGSGKRSRAFFVAGVASRPAFRRFWFGQSVSQLGSAVSNAALPLIAAIIVHATPFQMGVLVALETIPSLVFTIPSGVFADRRDRRRILIAADVARGGVIFLVPLGAVMGFLSFNLLAFVAFAMGALTVLFDISIESFMPEVVPEADLMEGFQHMEVASSGSSIVGSSLGGILLGTVGVFLTVMINALSYVVSVVSLLFVRRPADVPPATLAEPAGAWQELWAGLRLVAGDRRLRDLAVSTALINLGNGFMLALLVLFATRNLGLNAAEYGGLYAISNIGFLIGVSMVRSVSEKLGSGRALTLSVFLTVAAIVMIPFSTPGIGIILLVIGRFINAMANTTYNIILRSTRQTLSPSAFRGKITGSFRMISWGVLPIGSLVGGTLGGMLGITQTMWLAAIFVILAIVVLRVGPVWQLDITDETPLAKLAAPQSSPSRPVPSPAVATRSARPLAVRVRGFLLFVAFLLVFNLILSLFFPPQAASGPLDVLLPFVFGALLYGSLTSLASWWRWLWLLGGLVVFLHALCLWSTGVFTIDLITGPLFFLIGVLLVIRARSADA